MLNCREHGKSFVLDKSEDQAMNQSASGFGDILHSLQGKLYRKPAASKSVGRLEQQKRVILEKFRD